MQQGQWLLPKFALERTRNACPKSSREGGDSKESEVLVVIGDQRVFHISDLNKAKNWQESHDHIAPRKEKDFCASYSPQKPCQRNLDHKRKPPPQVLDVNFPLWVDEYQGVGPYSLTQVKSQWPHQPRRL